MRQDRSLGKNHGTILRQSGTSKTNQSGSQTGSTAMSTSSSVALKQMLEQRKRQQISSVSTTQQGEHNKKSILSIWYHMRYDPYLSSLPECHYF